MISKELYFVWGLLAAVFIAFLGYRSKALTYSGAIAAIVVGTIIFGFGGYVGAAALIYFFLTGSILSRLPKTDGLPLEKGARDWKQVVCNGGAATFAVILIHFDPSYRESGTLFFFGALATATADTWATEFGIRGSKRVYHILTFRPVERGVSGGVSLAGILASLFGAATFSLIPLLLLPGDDLLCGLFLVPIFPFIALAGIVGSLLDSIIGATLQVKYKLPDGTIVEKQESNARRVSGIPFVTNDLTNLIATIWGGLIAVGLITL